jgi:nucleotidyltransferase substrate binding protein (TIGR01987 family)
MGNIDYTSLQKAVASFQDAVNYYNRANTDPEKNVLKAAVIKNYEITVEMGWKMLQKTLLTEGVLSDPMISKSELFRLSMENGLITDATKWQTFYRNRNLSVHTYGEEMSDHVLQKALQFLPEIQDLSTRLNQR